MEEEFLDFLEGLFFTKFVLSTRKELAGGKPADSHGCYVFSFNLHTSQGSRLQTMQTSSESGKELTGRTSPGSEYHEASQEPGPGNGQRQGQSGPWAPWMVCSKS